MTHLYIVILILLSHQPIGNKSMGEKEQIEKFYLSIKAKNNIDKCPFIVGWFNSKVEEIEKLPDEHGRSGIAKGDRLPIPKAKRLLALHDVVFKKFRLKEFCELKAINHGTGRNWRNTDKIFKEIALGFAEEFSHAFLRRYSELVEQKLSEGFFKAFDLIKECRHYPVVTVEQIKVRLKNYVKQKSDGADPLDTLSMVNNLLFSVLVLCLKNKGADRNKYIQKLEDHENQDYDASFDKLREKYKSPEAQEVIEIAKTIGDHRKIYYLTIAKAIFD